VDKSPRKDKGERGSPTSLWMGRLRMLSVLACAQGGNLNKRWFFKGVVRGRAPVKSFYVRGD